MFAAFARGENGGFGKWLRCHSRRCSFKTLPICSSEYLLRCIGSSPPETDCAETGTNSGVHDVQEALTKRAGERSGGRSPK